MNYEPVIGLEIHVELKTKSKMFSAAPVIYGAAPNSAVALLDMAYPGTLPRLNKEAVIYGIRVAGALHMKIDRELHFDRKNYFYSDLPKGYQITQNRRPLGRDGWLMVDGERGLSRIGILDLHLEEDTCMQHHYADCTLLDFNRAGVPLIEIVSAPELRSGLEAMHYVEKIRSIVVFAGVSDGRMEEGSLRCDVNVSLRPKGREELGAKVEIKNLNSISSIQRALDFEIKRQAALLEAGEKIPQETRRWDETTRTTIRMRLKTDAVDYKYFPEANLLPVRLSEEFINAALSSCPELAEAKIARYQKDFGLNAYDASTITMDQDLAAWFEKAAVNTRHHKLLANWLLGDVTAYLNKEGISIREFPLSPSVLVELIEQIAKEEISNAQGREIFAHLLVSGGTIQAARRELGITGQIADQDALLGFIKEVITAFPDSVRDYQAGKERALGFLIGQVMKRSHGKANPKLTSELLIKELKKEN